MTVTQETAPSNEKPATGLDPVLTVELAPVVAVTLVKKRYTMEDVPELLKNFREKRRAFLKAGNELERALAHLARSIRRQNSREKARIREREAVATVNTLRRTGRFDANAMKEERKKRRAAKSSRKTMALAKKIVDAPPIAKNEQIEELLR